MKSRWERMLAINLSCRYMWRERHSIHLAESGKQGGLLREGKELGDADQHQAHTSLDARAMW